MIWLLLPHFHSQLHNTQKSLAACCCYCCKRCCIVYKSGNVFLFEYFLSCEDLGLEIGEGVKVQWSVEWNAMWSFGSLCKCTCVTIWVVLLLLLTVYFQLSLLHFFKHVSFINFFMMIKWNDVMDLHHWPPLQCLFLGVGGTRAMHFQELLNAFFFSIYFLNICIFKEFY